MPDAAALSERSARPQEHGPAGNGRPERNGKGRTEESRTEPEQPGEKATDEGPADEPAAPPEAAQEPADETKSPAAAGSSESDGPQREPAEDAPAEASAPSGADGAADHAADEPADAEQSAAGERPSGTGRPYGEEPAPGTGGAPGGRPQPAPDEKPQSSSSDAHSSDAQSSDEEASDGRPSDGQRQPVPDGPPRPGAQTSPEAGEPSEPAPQPPPRRPQSGGGRGSGSEQQGEHPQPPRTGSDDRPAPPSSPQGGRTPPDAPRRTRPFGGGILMGRPFGVPVYVAPSWFVVAALITWVFGGQLDRVLPHLGVARYLIALFFAVAFYASVLVHELAHTVAALRFGLPVRRIQLQFFGGVSEIEKESELPGREFVLAFVGPLLSLVLAGVFYGALALVEPGTVVGVLLAGLMLSNLIVAVFNLLPGLPLDGGRMLRALVWKISGKPMTGTVFAAWTGRALAIAVLIGLPLGTHAGGLARTGISGMDSLTDALLAAILAAIIWTGAGNSLRMARLREHLPELRARTLTRRAVPVQNDTPLSEGLRRANAVGARAMVVVDAHGEPMSVVRESAIAGVPEHRRPWVAVSTLAQDLKEGMRVPAELAGEELLEHLRATPATEYLVVEDTGEIYGVLSTADVERAFVAAMAKKP